MKKTISSFLIALMLSLNFFVLATPKQAHAFLGFGDISFDPPVLLANLKDLALQFGEAALKRLANKVLNKMLKKTVNWAVTGFGPWGESAGQPFYIQNKDSLLQNIEDQQLVKTIQALGDNCQTGECPYAKDLARTLVTNYINGKESPELKFNLDSYSDNWQLFQQGKFSEGGGWKTFEGMISNPHNSKFGAFFATSSKVAEEKAKEVTKVKEDVTDNGGFLSMKKCVQYKPGTLGATSEVDFSKFNNTWKGDDKNPPTTTINTDGQPIVSSESELGQGGGITLGGDTSQNTGSTNTSTNEPPPKEYSGTETYLQKDRVLYFNNIFEAIKETKGNRPSTGQTSNEYWLFIKRNSQSLTQSGNDIVDDFQNTYALPGMEVDNCLRYETVTPGSMAKEMLGKTLTSTIDKQIADSSTGNSLLDSIVDMAAVFITNGLDKMITKATTKSSDQQVFAGGIGDPNTTYLGVGGGANTNSAWYSEDGKNDLLIQDPFDSTKLHPDIVASKTATQEEIQLIEELLVELRKMPELYRSLDMCLPGPDHGWEKRLKEEYDRAAQRLNKKSAKDTNRGEKAGEALSRLEQIFYQDISSIKLKMLSVIPSAVPIMSKISTIPDTSALLSATEKKYSQRVGALATVEAIEKAIAGGELDNASIVVLKKQYSGIRRGLANEETIADTLSDLEELKSNIDVSFNRNNPRSLMSKCITERKKLSDLDIGKDLGETLFCSWQTPNTVSHRTRRNIEKWALGGGFAGVGDFLFGDDKVVEEAGIETSPYDPGRNVQVYIGDKYTQNEAPFDDSGQDSEFQVACVDFYTAPIVYYEDQK